MQETLNHPLPAARPNDLVSNDLSSSKYVSFVFYFLIATLVWALSVLAFQGQFNPLGVYHLDHYGYVGMHAEGYGMYRYVKVYPRPVAHIIIDLCGRLGIHWLLAPVFAIALANAALAATLVERIVKIKIPLLSFGLFAAMIYANAWYQIHVKADPFAIFALAFALLSFHVWESYVERPRGWHIPAVLALVVLSSLTKESYFCVIGLFYSFQFLAQKNKRKAAAVVLIFSSAAMLYALHRSSETWILFHSTAKPTDAYYTDTSLRGVLNGFYVLSSYLVLPALAAGIALILVFAWRNNKRAFWTGSASVILGLVALIPNATLPNHLEPQYAVLGSELFAAPILLFSLIGRKFWERVLVACAVTIACGITIFEYSQTSIGYLAWMREQEAFAGKVLPALEVVRNGGPSGSFLVTGIDAPYSPFYSASFIEGLMGRGRLFTVIVPDSVPESVDRTVRRIHASNPLRLRQVNEMLKFSHEGALVAMIPNPSLSQLAEGSPLSKTQIEAVGREGSAGQQ